MNYQLDKFDFNSQGVMVSWYFNNDSEGFGTLNLGLANNTITSSPIDSIKFSGKSTFAASFNYSSSKSFLFSDFGLNYYRLEGDITKEIPAEFSIDPDDYYLQNNNYSIFELPLSTGIFFELNNFSMQIGMRYSLFHGSNNYDINLYQNSVPILIEKNEIKFNDHGDLFYFVNFNAWSGRNFHLNCSLAYSNPEYYFASLTISTHISN